MKIVQVNYSDGAGGAARIASLLHQKLQFKGHASWMIVGRRYSQDQQVVQIPDVPSSSIVKYLYHQAWLADQHSLRFLFWTVGGMLRRLATPKNYWDRFWGIENFNFPNSRRLLELLPAKPDIVHLHNLHQDYFDLRYLPNLSSTIPTVATLHDAWLLSGHCAHALDCDRWKTGCGYCPHLDIYPKIKRDSTRYNWNRKRHIYQRSKLYIAAPSQWMMDKFEESILAPAVRESRVIHNGIDLEIFHPLEQGLARKKLGLPLDAKILLFVANAIKRNSYKDYQTIEAAVGGISGGKTNRKILVFSLGAQMPDRVFGNVEIHAIPFSSDPAFVANYYQAADVYLHAARAETFGMVIAEAMACGLPVIATGVGGIPELVKDGETGYLVPGGDANLMAERIEQLLNDDELRKRMGVAAFQDARKRFGLDLMLTSYLEWYQDIIENFPAR